MVGGQESARSTVASGRAVPARRRRRPARRSRQGGGAHARGAWRRAGSQRDARFSNDRSQLAINSATVKAWSLRAAASMAARAPASPRSRPGATSCRRCGVERAGKLIRDARPDRDLPLPWRHVSRPPTTPAAAPRSTTTAAPSTRRPRIGAHCLVLVAGGLPKGSKRPRRRAASRSVTGWRRCCPMRAQPSMPLAIEPLHPMYAADRACVNTLGTCASISATSWATGARRRRSTSIMSGGTRTSRADRARRQAHPRLPRLRLAGADHATCCSTAACWATASSTCARIRAMVEATGYRRPLRRGDFLRAELVEARSRRGAADLPGAAPDRGVIDEPFSSASCKLATSPVH